MRQCLPDSVIVTGLIAVALSIALALISCCMFLGCTRVDSLVVDIELLDTTLDGIIMCGATAGKNCSK